MSVLSGFYNINKPIGITSTRVTHFIKKTLQAKVGHIGTLDPFASGVLPIAIGKATKLIPLIENVKKSYDFCIQFGTKTDSGDNTGQIIQKCDYIPNQQQCSSIVNQFVGDVEQTPNIFSAVKIGGVRAYKLARQGKLDLLPKTRIIKIYSLQLNKYDKERKRAYYCVQCSKGTYIRSLAQDIAQQLNSLGYVDELTRTQSGNFSISDSVCFNQITHTNQNELRRYLSSNLLHISSVITDVQTISIDANQNKRIVNGDPILLKDVNLSANDIAFCCFNGTISALGFVKIDRDRALFYPKKLLQ